ncbi:putative metalloprotease with PDZ domain [Rhodoferax ferrireducens]|uniref:Metalloprotease with PDZ domain n=1 Tax=Rhodoferax ferrireducens TaxID=192843 RepID=A0ABU2CCU6_9BURK|nr:peptidase M61 [Rhodoferax ferrireducens]MDR7379153.1 putative metalloprotease with PDZ domain [Rhodoferax ferrireducens]
MPTSSAPCPVHYRVEVADLHAHLFRVTLTIAQPAAVQRVSLPVWIPGSYLVREFSKNLQHLQARQGKRAVPLLHLDKNSWEVAANPAKPLVLSCEVYANDASVRTAWLDATRGFFNGTSLFLRVHGQDDAAHSLELVASKPIAHWSVATGLAATAVDSAGFGHYQASNYDELVDCPFELGSFWSGKFKAGGVPHRFVVAGAPPSFDGARLLADTKAICEEEIRFWHGKQRGSKAPHKNYVFMLNAVDDGYGGLEHCNSTVLVCNRRDLPRTTEADGKKPASPPKRGEGYTTLLGLISHEYFHTWNVKRLRPAEFARYQYDAEQYTPLLWFFEGFTSYYDDLLLRRAGLLDNAGYLKLLNKTINQVQQTPGRLVQSVAQASRDAWVKYYRQDENTPNATVSYYTKGALVALCFDLTLRGEGQTTLDEVMRTLWTRCQAGPMREADFAEVLAALGGRSFDAEIQAWVHGTGELPLKDLLAGHGVAVHEDPAQLAQRLGLRVGESQGLQVKVVLRGGAAEQAGMAAGDEWLAVELADGSGWRMSKLDDLLLYAGHSRQVTALVARDKRLLRLPLTLPSVASTTTWRLAAETPRSISAWLEPSPE